MVQAQQTPSGGRSEWTLGGSTGWNAFISTEGTFVVTRSRVGESTSPDAQTQAVRLPASRPMICTAPSFHYYGYLLPNMQTGMKSPSHHGAYYDGRTLLSRPVSLFEAIPIERRCHNFQSAVKLVMF